MASASRRIRREEWERHRGTIISLYSGRPLKEVRSIMHDEHGFEATVSQFEAQLRQWGVRKNMKRTEWEKLFQQGDVLHSESPSDKVIISSTGLMKSNTSVNRARRWVKDPRKRASPESRNSNERDSNKSVDQANTESRLSLDQSFEPASARKRSKVTAEHLPTAGVLRQTPQSLLVENDSSLRSDTNRQLDTTLTPMDPLPILASPTTISQYQLPSIVRHPTHPGFREEGSPEWSNITFHFGSSEKWFRRLPFARFEETLHWPGIEITTPFISQHVEQETSYGNCNCALQWPLDHRHGPRGLSNYLPEDSGTVATPEQAPGTDFTRNLLFSLHNAFAGLGDVPPDYILKFSIHHWTTKSMLLRMLKESPPNSSKALAENIFRAAIEIRDERVVKLLLECQLVDANNTVCFYDGQRYTAVERAASLKSYSLVQILALFGADVNKTYSPSNSLQQGALDRLIQAACRSMNGDPGSGLASTPDLIRIVDLLVAVGATLSPELLESVVIDSTTSGLACSVSFGIPKSKHQILFRERYSYRLRIITSDIITVAKYADDIDATSMIRRMIDNCIQSECRVCLIAYSRSLEQAALEGAIRGHLQLVELLIDHIQSLRDILAGAIRSKNKLLIEFIVKRGAELKPPTRRLKDGDSHLNQLTYVPAISLDQIVQSGNDELVHHPERAEMRNDILDGGWLETLVAAAVEEGNISSIETLLLRAASSKQPYRPSASILVLAVEGGHDAIAHLLLDSGAEVDHHRNSGTWEQLEVDDLENIYAYEDDYMPLSKVSRQHEENWAASPLRAALRQRNGGLVRAILSADIQRAPGSQVFVEVAQWGDRTVMADLILTFPELRNDFAGLRDLCQICIATNNTDFFRSVLDFVGYSPSSMLATYLEIAIKASHTEMIEYLLDNGADPFSQRALKAAMPKHQYFLQELLDRTRQRRATPRCITAKILQSVITDEPGNAEALNVVLEMGAVDLRAPVMVYSDRWRSFQDFLTPLGLAIRGSSDRSETNFSAVEKLLKGGSDADGVARLSIYQGAKSRVRISQTALLLAIETGRIDTVQLLIDHGSDIGKKPHLSIKQTPLQCAAETGNLDIVRLLLNLGADVNGAPALRSGGTALQYAAISGNCNVAAELLEHGAQLHARPSKVNGRWPLEGAAEHGRLDMIQFLWNVAEDFACAVPLFREQQFSRIMDIPGFQERHCLRAMSFAQENGHIGCRDLISDLSRISMDRLETDEYGAQWLAY